MVAWPFTIRSLRKPEAQPSGRPPPGARSSSPGSNESVPASGRCARASSHSKRGQTRSPCAPRRRRRRASANSVSVPVAQMRPVLLGRADRQDGEGTGARRLADLLQRQLAPTRHSHSTPSLDRDEPNIVARCRRQVERDTRSLDEIRGGCVGRSGVLHGHLRGRPWHREVQDGPARPLPRDDARLRALHRGGARHARPVARRRRACRLAGPRRDRPASVAPELAFAPGQPLPARRALPDVPAHRAHAPGGAGSPIWATSSTSGSRRSSSSCGPTSSGAPSRGIPATRSTSRATTRSGCSSGLDFLDEMVRYMNELGWDVYSFDHEDGNGQYEIDFTYTDALKMADRFVLFRMMAKEVARSHGYEATFMPKPCATGPAAGRTSTCRSGPARRQEPVRSGDSDERRGSASRSWATVPRRRPGARAGDRGRHLPDGQLVQAPDPARRDERLHLGAGVHLVRAQQPHAHAARADEVAARRVASGRRVVSTPTSAPRCVLAAGLEGIERSSTRDRRTTATCTSSRTSRSRVGVGLLPRTLGEAIEAFEATRSPRRSSAGTSTRRTSTSSEPSGRTSTTPSGSGSGTGIRPLLGGRGAILTAADDRRDFELAWTPAARPRHDVLRGERVRLEPVDPDRHAEELFAASHGAGTTRSCGATSPTARSRASASSAASRARRARRRTRSS